MRPLTMLTDVLLLAPASRLGNDEVPLEGPDVDQVRIVRALHLDLQQELLAHVDLLAPDGRPRG